MNILPACVPPWNRSKEDPQGLFDAVFDGVDEAILILEKSADLVLPVISDANMTFTRWTRIERERIQGASFADVLDVECGNGLDRMAALFSEARNFEIESALISEQQLPIPVHICVQPTANVNGLRKYTAVARRADKIERQAAELARRERDQALMAREKLLSRLNHDLRTPLNGILGFSEIMKEELLGAVGDERYRDYAHNIYMAGKQLLWKIEELLDLKSFEEDSWPSEESTFDVRDLIEKVCKEVVSCIAGDTLLAENRVPLGLPAVTADRGLFHKAVAGVIMTHLMSERHCDRIQVTAGLTSRGDIALCIDMSSGEAPTTGQDDGSANTCGKGAALVPVDEDEYSLTRVLLDKLGANLNAYRSSQEHRQFILTMPAYRIG